MQQTWLKGKAITKELLSQYFKEKYGQGNLVELHYFNVIQNITPLLQSDYGLEGDCTITSMTCILHYLYGKAIQTVYNIVESIAKKYGYNGKFGTIPTLINRILKQSEQKLQVQGARWKAGYIKNIGFNFNTIVKSIDLKHPLILSINSDGRGYYTNHSVTVVGCASYVINKKQQRFLLLYDNWHKYITYLDYEILGKLCSLNYYI